MTIRTLEALFDAFRDLGATHTFCKRLAENDNSKQQIYLGGSLDALNMLPFGEVASDASAKRPNMKAPLKLLWLDEAGRTAPAPGAQLILYPDYPEVRLSGFLRGCARAPAAFLQPVPRERRKFDNAPDGRILFLANHPDRHLIAFLAPAGSAIAEEFENQAMRWRPRQRGVFLDIPLQGNDARSALLARLREIHAAGWHASRRLNAQRVAQPYIARNGAGYTLEALFGIVPNSKAQPDFLGWELKACGSDRITLMTPEPDSGFYGKHGAEEFVRKFGHQAGGDTLYFTGLHRVGELCRATGQTLAVRGFDIASGKIVDVGGGVYLIAPNGSESAGWSFSRLLEHWGRKHAAAAYVPYEKEAAGARYRYLSPASLGEGTEFVRFLRALVDGAVAFDPGSKVVDASTKKSKVKARSQFRIGKRRLRQLYERFTDEPLDPTNS